MKNFLLTAALVLVSAFLGPTQAAHAETAETRLERKVFYQFDPAYANPKHLDQRLEEVHFNGQVLWVGQPQPGKPTIYYLPGSGGNLGSRRHLYSWVLDRGYGIVAFAYPGMAGSKGRPSRKLIQSLANQIYQHLPDFVGNSPTIIWGESLGTGVALEVAISKSGQQRPPLGIILKAPYTSLVDLVAYKQPQMMTFLKHRTDLWPSKQTIRRVKTPLLIMHGAKDKVVPIRMGRKLYELSPSPNKKFLTHPDSGHTTIWQVDVLAAMLKWTEALY